MNSGASPARPWAPIGLIALLVTAGCSNPTTLTGFDGTPRSELANGAFTYANVCAPGACEPSRALPAAIGKGATFSLSFDRYAADPDHPEEISLRSASPAKVVELPPAHGVPGTRFDAVGTGVVAVIATSSAAPAEVVDLVHLRIIAPTRIQLRTDVNGGSDRMPEIAGALERGRISIAQGGAQPVVVKVMGVVDAENGPLLGTPVGELVELEGIQPMWTSSDDAVVAIDPTGQGGRVRALKAGSARVNVSAGDVSKTIEVTVLERGVPHGDP